ncbi:MAG: bifunctional phosphopantothenoylcysteine decarboxylase/phosphopantothenate--cysteine ligase CoaBC [Gemmatimonadaceae bacterium]|nr:bifunctional phosphopantothenoylcysteine decarboxylase/phosphopantothenate--cysteine ligase CoaBC [Gemmatimonadaceae bacterium]
MRLEGRRVLLGVSGGIAAYKAPLVLRLLQEEGAEARVVRTASAARFVTDPTLSVLSGHPVHGDLFAADEEFPVLHVGLAGWAELLLVAPATANLLGKMAAGIADDLLTTICLATPAPVLLAPAMEEEMLEHPRVQANAASLRAAGAGWIEPESGYLASGASGRGRMASPEVILEAAVDRLTGARGGDLEGLRILVTAGPTVEDLDPVRFLSNRSSGKMGFALARRARQRGAEVHLVTGPVELSPPEGVRTTFVRSAAEMLQACDAAFEAVDAAFMAAAVSDYRPRHISAEKLKRAGGQLGLELVENPDIAATLGARKGGRVLVAFAMETEDGEFRAREKGRRKQADLVVLNDLRVPGAGFAGDTNVVTVLDGEGTAERLPRLSKLEVADRLLDRVRDLLGQRRRGAGEGEDSR